MSKGRVTRRQLLVAAAPAVAAAPLVKLGLPGDSEAVAAGPHSAMAMDAATHAAMIGSEAPAPERSDAIDALLHPPPALPHEPGRVREYAITAVDREIEVAKGVFYNAWTYNGTVPGPVIRATEDDLLRVAFTNAGSHPHTIHFPGVHPANLDGVFGIVS